MPTHQRQSDRPSSGNPAQPAGDTRLSIAESAAAIEQLKTFPEKVRAARSYTRTPKRTEVDRLLRDMERQFETANLFDDDVIAGIINIGERIKTLLREKPKSKPSHKATKGRPDTTPTEIPPEVKSLRETLTADYDLATTNLTWYGILETAEDGSQYYRADYDGSTEKDPNDEEPDETKRRPCPNAENFTDQTFAVPTLEQIMVSLTPEQAALYREYAEKGLQPRLQLTPLALKLRTMAAKLDAKKEEINSTVLDRGPGSGLIRNDTYIWDARGGGEIDETKLLYEPATVETTPDGQQLITKNGLTKSQLIKKYNGWRVEIVPMKPELEPDADKTHKEITKAGKTEKIELTNAEKTALYMEEARARGESGQGYEDNLMAQMNALAADTPAPLEKEFWTVLSEFSLTKNKNIVAVGYWNDVQVALNRNASNDRRSILRFRRSVRVKILEL